MPRFVPILILVTLLCAAPASAASHASLVPTPSTPTVGQTFTLSGCGYPKGKLITIEAGTAGTFPYQNVYPDASGCVSATFTAFKAGEWYAWAGFASAPYKTLVPWFEFEVSP